MRGAPVNLPFRRRVDTKRAHPGQGSSILGGCPGGVDSSKSVGLLSSETQPWDITPSHGDNDDDDTNNNNNNNNNNGNNNYYQ